MFDMKNFNTNLLHLTFKLGIPSLIPICFVKSIWFCQNETNLNKTGRYLPRSPIVGWSWLLGSLGADACAGAGPGSILLAYTNIKRLFLN